jgi:glycosyltransferase involved in cell wall biosynthesis
VSAVIPTYNRADLVARAVESALNQTVPLAEVIVIDDGSKDNTAEALAPYRDRIRYIYQPNGGISAARNSGVSQATGNWIAFLDSDDAWMPHKNERQLAALASQTGAILVYSGLRNCLPDGSTYDSVGMPAAKLWPTLRYRNFVTPSTTIILKSALQSVGGFYEHLPGAVEDWDLAVRLRRTGPFAAVEEPLILYTVSLTGASARPAEMLLAEEAVMQRTLISDLSGARRGVWTRKIHAAMYWRAALGYRALADSCWTTYLWRSLLQWPIPGFYSERYKALLLSLVRRGSGRPA